MAGHVDARLPGVDENCVLDAREANRFPYRFPRARLSILASKLNDLRRMDVFAGANFFEQLRVQRGVEI